MTLRCCIYHPRWTPTLSNTLRIAFDATQDEQLAEVARTLREHSPTLKGFVNTCAFLTQRVPAP